LGTEPLDIEGEPLEMPPDERRTIKCSKYSSLYAVAVDMEPGDILYIKVPHEISNHIYRDRVRRTLIRGIDRPGISFLVLQHDQTTAMILCRESRD